MVTNRSYQNARGYVDVCKEIRELGGAQFDPKIVVAFGDIPEDDWDRIRQGDVKWVASAVKSAIAPRRKSA